MLRINSRSTLLHAFKNTLLYQWIVLGNYIVELFWTGNINTNMSPCLFQDMWRGASMNITKTFQHAPILHHKKWEVPDYGSKAQWVSMTATNLS